MRDKSRDEVQDQDELDAKARFKTMTDRTGQTWSVARGHGHEPITALVVRSSRVDVNFGLDDPGGALMRHELLCLDGKQAGSFGHLYEGSTSWESKSVGWHDRAAGTSYVRLL